MPSFAMPAKEARLIERVSSACLAFVLAIMAYGSIQFMPRILWNGAPLANPSFPVVLFIVVGGAPLVLETGLLFTGSLERPRAKRLASALVLFVVAVVLSPHAFFQALPDPLVTPFVFHLITELALISIVSAMCLLTRNAAWWALGLVGVHAVAALYLGQIGSSGATAPKPWLVLSDLTLFTALLALAIRFAMDVKARNGPSQPAAA